MPPSEFLFALRFANLGTSDHVLGEVATAVFRQVGCEDTEVADLVERLHEVLASIREDGVEVDVQFRARSGSIEVIVLAPDRELLRTSRALSRSDSPATNP